MIITLVKQQNNTFALAYDSDYENAKKIKVGEQREFKTTKKRNYKFHKKFFGMLNIVFENQEIYTNITDLRNDVTVDAGYYKEHVNLHAEIVKTPLSISFASMDEYTFSEYYSKCLEVVIRHFGYDKQSLLDELSQHF